MLDGFGCYPLCIEIDLDSYDGPWTHVARFRNRSGWLLVADAMISVDNADVASYAIVIACDEYGEAIPDFMAPNLLACACSQPQLCDDFPPEDLEWQMDRQRDEIRRRWMRETYAELAQLDEQAGHDIEEAEGQTAAKIMASDRQIADLRRRRRMPGLTNEAVSIFDTVIAEIETYQDSLVERLATRRGELRRHYATLEQTLTSKIRPQIVIEPRYQLNWFDGRRRAGWEEEHKGAYRHSAASELASIEVRLTALRQEYSSSGGRYWITRLNKSKANLKAQLKAAKGD